MNHEKNQTKKLSVISTTVGHYLLYCLKKLGIRHLFGVPGDYQLRFLDQILEDNQNQQLNDRIEKLNSQDNKKIIWMGDTNELNAAYAQINPYRVGALVTTAGVGELSAINGIAGGFAEHHGLIHIVGHPSLPAQNDHKLLHHGLDETITTNFKKIASFISLAQVQITKETAVDDIAYALNLVYSYKKPVYLFLPSGEEKK